MLAGGLALLVAALITGVVIFTQGGESNPVAQPGSGGQTQLPPVPPPTTDPHSIDPITTAPDTTAPITTAPDTTAPDTTTAPITTAPDTTAPITTAPITTAPITTVPDTTAPITTPDTTAPVTTNEPTASKPSKPTVDSKAADKRAAERAATAWADSVTAGDSDGVLAVSCDQDLQAYDSGELQNPATLAGRYSLTFDRVILALPHGVAFFTIDPAIDSESSLTSFVTSTSGQWKVCMTVSDPADL